MRSTFWMRCGGGLLSLSAACGTDVGQEVHVTDISPGDECPNGGLLLDIDGNESVVCNGTHGADGEDGIDGADGKDGIDGEDGVDGRDGADGVGGGGGGGGGWYPVTTLYCSNVATFSSGGTARLYYRVIDFSDGSALVSCGAEATGTASSDMSILYASWQNGAHSKGCTVTNDADTPSSGWWNFETFSSGTMTATYNDGSSAKNGAYYTFTGDDCNVDSND